MLCDTTGDFVIFAIKLDDVFDAGFTAADVVFVGFELPVLPVLAAVASEGTVVAVSFWADMVVIEVTV